MAKTERRKTQRGGKEREKRKRIDVIEKYGLTARDTSAEDVQDLIELLSSRRRHVLRLPNVQAVDIGYRVDKQGDFHDEICLRVHVDGWVTDLEDKLAPPLDKLFGEGRYCLLGARYELSMADVGPLRPNPELRSDEVAVLRRQRINPLVGGISIGGRRQPAGTLGALVWDREDGSVCVLGNWHVLAGGFDAAVGDPCYQPGPFDHGNRRDVVARLKRWSFDSQTDAALAELCCDRRACPGEILSVYSPIVQSTEPRLGMKVYKSGRTTGFTSGFVDGIELTTVLDYGNGVIQVFDQQIHIASRYYGEPVSERGDSGAIWFTKDESAQTGRSGPRRYAVGLHFAGDTPSSPIGEFALANPMSLVEKRLGFSFRPVYVRLDPIPEEEDPWRQQWPGTSRALRPGADRRRGDGGPQPVDDDIGGGG
jgi:endonuclease G